MDKNLGTIIKIKQDGMIKAFEQNNMQITFVDNFEQLHNYLNDYRINARSEGIETKLGRWTLLQQLKLTRNLKLKLNENDIFVFFRFNEKKELIEIKLNIRPNSIVF